MSDSDLIEPRRDYTADTLHRAELDSNPIAQFQHWLSVAREERIIDATAMGLSTVDAAGHPHSRIVLLKQVDDAGFVWYTYRDSDKGQQLAARPVASLLFYWQRLERQVRIEGTVSETDDVAADEYFHSRPEGSRFSAAASIQSAPTDQRSTLEARVAELKQAHPDGKVARPERWGGYRLTPTRFEFWQGRADRLHDRFIYQPDDADGSRGWRITRLQP